MRFSSLIAILLMSAFSWGQYQFSGQVSEDFRNREVHLSLVEDYRKSSRVYLDQIFQKTTADSLGFFAFIGDNLPHSNRIYSIHVDTCNDEEGAKNHFLGSCNQMESVLFIAKNSDSLTLPVGNNEQAFCQIVSTNSASNALLQLEALKEHLIVDVLEQPGQVAKKLTFKKWIQQFQRTSQDLDEPLAELYAFAFLSNRENETHPHYLEDLQGNPYYENLAARLDETYPKTSFTEQYKKELQADRTLISAEPTAQSGFKLTPVLFAVLAFAILSSLFLSYQKWNRAKNENPFETLSPQERKVLNAILEGKSNKEIASDFFISLSTVKSHINSLYKKLGMSSRSEIFSYYKGKS